MKTKLFSLFLMLVSIGTIFASDKQVGGIWYDFNHSGLTATVTYRGSSYSAYSNEYSGAVTIPSSVKYYGDTYTVTGIGTYAFCGCTGLTSVTIGNGVKSIGNAAFFDCSRLMKINFGKAIEKIEKNAFGRCPYLLEIHAPMEYPPVIDASVFAECGDLGGIDCYVPEESLALYTKVDVWRLFNLRTESALEASENVAVNQSQSVTKKLLRNGQILILRGDRTYTVTGQEVR